jgi:SAM-dependent methyltransferase
MPDVTSSIQTHYGSDGLIDRMMAALTAAGQDTAKPTVDMLNRVDQLHVGGLNSTKTLAELVSPTNDIRVLDAGCGVGGSSRYLAQTYGCRVEGIDLTPQYVEAAARLNELCGIDDKISVRQGSVTDLPYADGSFDLVWFPERHHERGRQAPDVCRSLSSASVGRSLLAQSRGAGSGRRAYYPLPWARNASYSFLETPEEISDLLRATGFTNIETHNETGKPAGATGRGSADLGASAILGAEMPERQAN